MIVDQAGEPLVAAHACKGNVRYRYYVSRALQHGSADERAGIRLPAKEIEAAVAEQVAELFDNPIVLAARMQITLTATSIARISERCAEIARAMRQRSRRNLSELVAQLRVLEGSVEIDMSTAHLAEQLGMGSDGLPDTVLTLIAPMRLTRTWRAVRLISTDGSAAAGAAAADPTLVRLIVRARKWWSMLAEGQLDVTSWLDRRALPSPI
ncbi:MAG: hypothetical protein H7X93_03240 [Sphingomonadaceae bacterium]|nr:hypothetical protein [Sphingomonadaceae bacterium]